jgi:hypothetical protein
MPTVEDVMRKYIETREEISEKTEALDKELKPMRDFQKAREEWLTAQLDAAGVNSMAAKGVATAFFKKNEWVKVDDWDVFLKEQVFKPLAKKIEDYFLEVENAGAEGDLLEAINTFFPFEFFKKDVVKEPIMALMGDVVIEKDEAGNIIKEARPNPPPPGISYGAKRVIQIHKK